MSSRRVIVSARAIAALLPFVSKEETRYYLNGIHIEPAHPQFGGVILAATDGHKMGIVHDLLGSADGSHIVTAPPMLRRMLGRTATNRAMESRVHFIGTAAHLVTTEFPDNGNVCEPGEHHLYSGYAPDIDGTFPNWRKLLLQDGKPLAHTGCAVVVNSEHFNAFINAAACLRSDRRAHPILRMYAPTENGPALITAEHQDEGLSFAGYLMPHRDVFTGDGKTPPAWFAAAPSPETKAA